MRSIEESEEVSIGHEDEVYHKVFLCSAFCRRQESIMRLSACLAQTVTYSVTMSGQTGEIQSAYREVRIQIMHDDMWLQARHHCL